MSKFPLPKTRYIIGLSCILLIGILAAAYLQSDPSNHSTADRHNNKVSDHAPTLPTDDSSTETAQPDPAAAKAAMELAAMIEQSKLDRSENIKTIKQWEQEVKQFDEIADKSIELLYQKTGTTEEEFKKRFAAESEQ